MIFQNRPINYIGFIQNLNDEDSIVNIDEDYLRRKLKDVLIKLEFDPTKYSWHYLDVAAQLLNLRITLTLQLLKHTVDG